MPTAIIIGASSGIGAGLAVEFAAEGYRLGLAARRLEHLDALAAELPTDVVTRRIDISDVDAAVPELEALIEATGPVDVFVLCAGVGWENLELEWKPEHDTIATNVMGFAAMARVAAHHLEANGEGHLVGISSITADRGNGGAPAYGASKAFESSYLDALRHRFARQKLPIRVTDVRPGFVDTAMAKSDRAFWVAPVDKAARQIVRAVRAGKSRVYVTRRWAFVGWVMRHLPDWLYHKI